MLSKEQVMERLKGVIYPGFEKSIVDFGFVKRVEVGDPLQIDVEIVSSNPEVAQELKEDIQRVVKPDVAMIRIIQPKMPEEKSNSQSGKNIAPQIKNFVMVSSGKGGVGKSTTTLNLAISMAKLGKKVGLLDADIYGPNIPRMLGENGTQPQVTGNKLRPIVSHGIEMMSMGVLMEEGASLIWRGSMIMKAIEQLLKDVLWSDLDVKLQIPIAGIVENMSGFICPDNGKEYDIFGKGTTEALAKEYNTKILAEIPIEPAVRVGGDSGKPISFYEPSSVTAKRYEKAAAELWEAIEKINNEGGADNSSIQPVMDGKSACSK